MKVVVNNGVPIELGTTEASPTIGIIDYSRRVTDDFGVTTVVERGFSRRMSVRLALPTENVDGIQRQLAQLRATAAHWIADDSLAWLSIEGFYKDFELDLAVPPLSFCTLTVEGLAETEVGVDDGADPAPDGSASTLRLLQPVEVTSAMLVASSVPEADYAVWAAGTNYAAGARVISTATHRVYESASAGNVGHDPAAGTGEWIDLGPTNRWAMLDQAVGTATTSAGNIAITLDVDDVDSVALLDVVAGTVRVQAPGYDRTLPVASGAALFLDLPETDGQITVTVTGQGQVAVGTLLVGRVVSLGTTGASPTAGIIDFSRKETDEFGEVTVVARAWAKRMAATALIRTDAVDIVANRIASVRAVPSLWIGDESLDSLTVYGFFKDFSIEVGENVSTLSLSIEGLSEATKPGALAPNWTDVVDNDPDNRPKPDDGATVGAPAGTNVGGVKQPDGSTTGGVPAEQVPVKLDELRVDVDDLVTVYGDTVSAAASAAAANTYMTAAQTARDQAQSARAAADDAKTAALSSANLASSKAADAAGSASAAAGSAATATTKATEAGQSASSAQASATTAQTNAGNAQTYASQAATSESNAAGSANAAASSAGVAATARDSAAFTAAMLLPDRYSSASDASFTNAVTANPATAATLLSNYTDPSVGPVYQAVVANSLLDFANKGVVPAVAGRIYEVTATYEVVSFAGGGGNMYLAVRGLSAAYGDLLDRSTVFPITATGVFTRTIMVSNVGSATAGAWPAGSVWLRPYLRTNTSGAGNSATVRIRTLSIRDVTAREAAAASASAASTSASNAAASATTAGQQASAAQQSATNAATSAGSAQTYAGQASTSATNADGSAQAAAASAGVVANYLGTARQYAGDAYFQNGLDGWARDLPGTLAPLGSVVTRADALGGKCYRSQTGTATQIISRKWYTINTARRYVIRARFQTVGPNSAQVYIGFAGEDASGAMVDHGGFGTFRYAAETGGLYTQAQGWQERNVTVTGEGNDAWTKFPPGTKRVQLVALLNWGAAAAGTVVDLNYLDLYDAESELAAAGSASAAATSASSASTSATNAGTSATSAAQSAQTASTAAGNAQTQATNAQTSAASASSSAAAALTSMTLSASAGGGQLNVDPKFTRWSVVSGLPDYWSGDYAFSNGGTLTRATGENGLGYAAQIGATAASNAYISTTVGDGATRMLTPGAWYVVEADVRLNAGSFSGAGILFREFTSANVGAQDNKLYFFTDPDSTGATVGAGVPGTTYRFRKLFQSSAAAYWFRLYCMAHWDVFGGAGAIAAANNVTFVRVGVRPASDAELAGYQSWADVRTLSGAVADMYGRQSAFWQVNAAVGGSAAAAFLTVRADTGTPAAAPFTAVAAGTTVVARQAYRSSGANTDWNNGFASVETYTGSAYAQANPLASTTYQMFGLSDAALPTTGANFHYANIDYAIYLQNNGLFTVYQSGSLQASNPAWSYNTNDYFSVQYSAANGGTISYAKNGVEFYSITAVGTGRTFRFLSSLYNVGATNSGVANVVFGPSGPTTASSVAIGAREIALYNTEDGTNAQLALKITNGNVALAGNLYAGGKIIQGNGDAGWEVALRPSVIPVTDGQVLSWPNAGRVPSYSFSTVGLAPLNTGETYQLSLTGLSATGATASLKISVPATPSSYNIGPMVAGGAGDPQRVISKGAAQDSTTGQYRFVGTASNTGTTHIVLDGGTKTYVATITVTATIYAKLGGTWTAVRSLSTTEDVYGTAANEVVTAYLNINELVTIPNGATDFGASGGSSVGINSVQWTGAGAGSGVRSATPNGQTCSVTITP